MILYILLGIIAVIAIYLVMAYNGLVRNKNLVGEGWSGIDDDGEGGGQGDDDW